MDKLACKMNITVLNRRRSLTHVASLSGYSVGSNSAEQEPRSVLGSGNRSSSEAILESRSHLCLEIPEHQTGKTFVCICTSAIYVRLCPIHNSKGQDAETYPFAATCSQRRRDHFVSAVVNKEAAGSRNFQRWAASPLSLSTKNLM